MTHKLCVKLYVTDGRKSMNQALKETWMLENYCIQEVDFFRPNQNIGQKYRTLQ